MPAQNTREFITEFVLHPKAIGAVTPSSHALARRVAGYIDWSNVEVAVEYGPGTGVVTQHILGHLQPGGRFLAIEINPRFAAILRERYPEAVICQDSVGNVESICEENDIQTVDAVVSGLPWSSFSPQNQTAYLDALMSVLRPGGLFLNYGYFQGLLLPAGQRFKKQLRRYFSEVRMSKPVWANLPPAFIYRCRR